MVIQLLLVGLILKWLFQQDEPITIIFLGIIMATIAGTSTVNQTKKRFIGIYINSLITVMGSATLITAFAITGIVKPDPWFTPQYLIPLLGMVLGNTINGMSLGLDALMEGLNNKKDLIETALALGASRWEACQHTMRESIRVAMIPTINSMMLIGLVSLPGMMTGQILQGADPAMAVRYQIVIMFMIASSTAIGVVGVVILAWLRLTNTNHQLCLHRLKEIHE